MPSRTENRKKFDFLKKIEFLQLWSLSEAQFLQKIIQFFLYFEQKENDFFTFKNLMKNK